jgi:type VI secretion system Hcp family effector
MPVVLGNKIVLLTLLSLTNLAQAETMCSSIKRLFNDGCSCGENGQLAKHPYDLPHDETITYWMRCTGAQSGDFNFETNDFDHRHAEEAQLFSFEQTVDVPINATTLQPVGPALRKHIKIIKKIDKSTPLFFMAIHSGEQMNCEIDMYRKSDQEADPENFFSVTLERARLVEMDTVNNYEQLAFISDGVKFTHNIAGTEYFSEYPDKST